MTVYDLFCFSGELDILEIRLNILSPQVDFFVIGESEQTFSGKNKPLYYKRHKKRYQEWESRIIYLEIPSYETANAFERAHFQKEYLKRGLGRAYERDIVFFGDVDEIWNWEAVKNHEGDDELVWNLRQLNYAYYLNNRSSEEWIGTIVSKFKNIRDGSLNELRANHRNVLENGGWHLTNMGGANQIRKKLESYDHQEFNNDVIKGDIEFKIENNEDYVGRELDWQGKPFTFWTDETQLPKYLLDNKKKWRKMFRS
jgi:beta-1,4-mannosyl-glycoprotein beta-1,4-N-acetylglucosaminyltransferase